MILTQQVKKLPDGGVGNAWETVEACLRFAAVNVVMYSLRFNGVRKYVRFVN